MRNLKFRTAYAENILPFGPQGVRFHFTDYGQVIQVKGINLDNPGTTDRPASNGAGKSSVQEILSIGLFGQTVKSPTKLKGKMILNTLADKGRVEVEWDDYRVVRSFKKTTTGTISGKLEAWHSPDHIWDATSAITKGGKPGVTQDWIDEKLGINHRTFCNVAIFDDSSFYSFLESDGPTKREFVENLLGLDQFRKYQDNAKNMLKEAKKAIEKLAGEYEMLCQSGEACDRRMQILQQQEIQWKTSKKSALSTLADRIKQKQDSLKTTNIGEQLASWQKGQDRITVLTQEIEDSEAKIKKIRELMTGVHERIEAAKEHKNGIASVIQQHNLNIRAAQVELDKQLRLISKLDNLEDGAECPTCLGVINKNNYGKVLKHSHDIAAEQKDLIRNENTAAESQTAELNKKSAYVTTTQNGINTAEGKIAIFEGKIRESRKEIAQLAAISKPEGTSREQVLEAEISELRKQQNVLKEELEGSSPYAEILIETEKEKIEMTAKMDNKSAELKVAEGKVPYYQFWIEAFGDRGIRRYVVDGIIPALNARIAYWMSYLIDSKIELTFNNELDETITRSGNPAFYYSMSNGERRRINLAVSQAFAYVMMLNSGCCPSLVFLDEITGGGIDRAGVVGIYNMIFELAKERQVFVTTHNENLMSMLQGCETLTLKKQNDITVLSS